MSNTILLKKSGNANAVPGAANLSLGEVALNYTDGNLFYKDGGGTVNLLVSNRFVSVAGNITGGNLLAGSGVITTSGNITGGNLNAAGLSLSSNVVSALNSTSNITTTANIAANYFLGNGSQLTGIQASSGTANRIANGTSNVDITSSDGNISVGVSGVGNVVVVTPTGMNITGTISANGNVTGGNLLAGTGVITTSGNITGGNLLAGSGVVTTSGNITGGNVLAGSGVITTSGNITGGNLNAAGLSLSSNVVSALVSAANITTSANIAANYFLGNGSQLTGITTNRIFNGTTEANIGSADANLAVTVSGVGNVAVFTPTGMNITGTVSANGNVTGGNILTGGLISATGNITAGNITTSGSGGNITGANVISATTFSASGNITGGNVLAGSGVITTSGNITGGNLNATGLSLSGNVVSALVSAANITTTANIAANYFIGNGSLLTGIDATSIQNGNSNVKVYANANVATSVNGVANVLVVTDTGLNITGLISANGNITGGNLLTPGNVRTENIVNITANTSIGMGNGSGIIGITSNANTTQFLPSGQINLGGVSKIAGGTFTGSYLTLGTSQTDLAQDRGGNVTVQVGTGGTIASTWTFTNSGNLLAPGAISAVGNVTGGNVLAGSGVITTSGNITGGNLNAAGLSLSSNVVSALNSTSNITTSANIAANVITGITLSASGNIIGGNLSVTANVDGGNVNTNNIYGTGLTAKSTGDLTLSATGNIVVNTYINNVTTPVQDADAANKGYVDAVAQGLDVKASVVYATAAALPAYTYNNGTSGVGATITANAVGSLSIDGSTPTANSRVLIKNETTTNAPYNGIYIVNTVGNGTAAFQMTRSTDFDNGSPSGEIPGAFTFVEAGSTNADTGWVCTTNAPVTMGSTDIVFAQFSGAGSYTANTSAGLSLTGSVFSAKVDGNTNPTIGFDGSGNLYVPAGAAFTTPNIGAATGNSVSVTGNITSGNLNAAGLSLSSNVVSALVSAANITTTANITGGNLLAGSGVITTSGNITGGNLLAGSGVITTSGNITGGNLNAAGLSLSSNVVSALNVTGNITGNNVNGVSGVYSGGVQVLTINDTVDGGTY